MANIHELDQELARSADLQVANQITNNAAEIIRQATPSKISVEAANKELGQAREDEVIATEVRKGPSRTARARYKNGSHTETQGSLNISSIVESVDAEGRAKKLIHSHGESSESFLSRGARSRIADRLDAVYREVGVPPVDRGVFREIIRKAEGPTVVVPDRPSLRPVWDENGIVSMEPCVKKGEEFPLVRQDTKTIAEQALEGLRMIRGYLREAAQARTKA